MTNEDRLDFIKANYKSSRAWELMAEGEEIFYEEWIDRIKNIIPQKLYKYRKCNNNNINALKNRKAWFSNPRTWNDKIDVTITYNLEKDLQYID